MALKPIAKRSGGGRQKQELERAQKLLKDKEIPQAQEVLHRIVEDDPECAFAHYLLGNTYFKEFRYGEALEAYEKALRNNPKLSTASLMMGIIHKKRGDNDEARAYLESSIDLDPDSVVAYTQLARALHELGKFDEAIDCVEHALSLNPQHTQGHLLMADLRAAIGDTSAASAILSEVIQDNPALVAARQSLGLIKMREGDLAGAKDVFKEATRVAPEKAILHYFLARIHFHLQEYHAAAAEFRAVVAKIDSFKGAQYGLADALTETESYEEAIEILRTLHKAAPRKNAAHQRFGLIHTRQGRYDTALLEFKAAVKNDPRIAEAMPAFAGLLEQRGEAEAVAKKAAAMFVESRDKQQIERAIQAETALRDAKKNRRPGAPKGTGAARATR